MSEITTEQQENESLETTEQGEQTQERRRRRHHWSRAGEQPELEQAEPAGEEIPAEQAVIPAEQEENTGAPAGQETEAPPTEALPMVTKVKQFSPKMNMPTQKKMQKPTLLSVEQYLAESKHEQGIAGLIRSLHRTNVMRFDEWEKEITKLLKKKI